MQEHWALDCLVLKAEDFAEAERVPELNAS
jgi:hypothetical protein